MEPTSYDPSEAQVSEASDDGPSYSGKRVNLRQVSDDDNGRPQFVAVQDDDEDVPDGRAFVAHFEENPFSE